MSWRTRNTRGTGLRSGIESFPERWRRRSFSVVCTCVGSGEGRPRTTMACRTALIGFVDRDQMERSGFLFVGGFHVFQTLFDGAGANSRVVHGLGGLIETPADG